MANKTMVWRVLCGSGMLVALMLVVTACAGAQGPQGAQGQKGDQGPQGPQGLQGLQGAAPSEADLRTLISKVSNGDAASPDSVARGGRIYDTWWKEVSGVAEPTGDHALWSLQTTNKRTGLDTWRCKECHGWDYKGKGGAYSKGSHFTGYPGVVEASQTRSKEELVGILRGAGDYRHNFSSLGDAALNDLANFLRDGLLNDASYIDYATKKPVGGNVANGKSRYDGTCASCHGSDGKQINFGTTAAPEYIGFLASDNPWEFLHKVRAGQPGTAMASAIVNKWTIQDMVDVVAYAQTLPK